MRGLAGKAAIVTGGSTGIGRAIMERLCEEGVSVTFSGISDGGVATEKECLEKGYQVRFVRGDMAEESFCRQLVDEALAKWGKINYLVNNAFPTLLNRRHLMMLLSDDGYKFNKAYVLLDDPTGMRMVGLLKEDGYMYPCCLPTDGRLLVAYSVNKEDIECGIVDVSRC